MTANPQDSPYVGLVPYSERDAERFCGRTVEIETLVSLTLGNRCIVVHGPSGVGKSSLLRAGVSATLQKVATAQNEAFGKPDFVVAYCSDWKESVPLQSVTAAIASAWRIPGLEASLDLRSAVTEGVNKRNTDLVLVLDQFEEFFLYHPDAIAAPTTAAGSWLSQIASLMGDSHNSIETGRATTLPVHLVIALREEALAKLDGLHRLIPTLFDKVYRVAPLTVKQAREAVLEPLGWWNQLHPDQTVSATEEFADRVAEEVRQGQVSFDHISQARQTTTRGTEDVDAVEAPFLQLVLDTVWHESVNRWTRDPGLKRELDAPVLAALGGAPAIVNNHLKRTLEESTDEDGRPLFSSRELELIARLSLHLVTVDMAKIAHSSVSLAGFVDRPVHEVEAILAKLEQRRILRRIQLPGKPGQDRYEIAHDMLGKAVVNWRPSYLEKVEISRLKQQAKQKVIKWSLSAVLVVLPILCALLVYALWASQAARKSADKAKAKSEYAETQRRLAEEQRIRAETQSRLAEEQRKLAEEESAKAKQLQQFAENEREAAIDAAKRDIQNQYREEREKRQALEEKLQVVTNLIDDLSKSQSSNRDDLKNAAVQINQSVEDLRDPRIGTLSPGAAIRIARYSPDGRYIAIGSENKKLSLWSRSGGDPLAQTDASSSVGGVKALAFSPTQGFLLTGSAGSSIRMFDPRRKTLGNGVTIGEQNSVNFINFSKDGRFSISFDDDRFAMLRDWSEYPKLTPSRPAAAWKHNGTITFADFSQDGSRVVTSCDDGKVRVFLTAGTMGLLDVNVSGSANNPLDVRAPTRKFRFSPADSNLVVGGAGYSKLVWFYLGGNRKALYQDHTKGPDERGPFIHGDRGAVWDVAFRPDGKYLASIGTDGLCLIWDTATAKTIASVPTEIGGRLFDAEWNHNDLLALAGEDGWIELWNLKSPTSPQKVFSTRAHNCPVWSLQFDPLGEQLLTHGRDIRPIEGAITNASGKAAAWVAPSGYPSVEFNAAIWDLEAAKRKGWSALTSQSQRPSP